MSLSSATNRNDYTGNGSVDTYSYTFKVFSEDHLVVTVRDTSDVETTLTKTTHYTVSGVGSTNGGSIALVAGAFDWLNVGNDLKSGYRLTIRRVVPLTQETDIRNAGTFYPATHEDQFDKQVMISQQQQDQINRSVKLPETVPSSEFDPTLPSDILDSANKVPMMNATGDGFTDAFNWPTANEISAAQGYALAADASANAAEASEAAALASEDLAEEWATKTNGIVDATEYSAKAWAVGGTGVTDTATRGSAKEWATKTSGTVDGTEYSAKKYAQDAAAALASAFFRDVVYITSASSPYTVSQSDNGKLFDIDSSGGAIAINLPEISGLSLPFNLAMKLTVAGNTVTISRGGTDTIDGGTSKILSVAGDGLHIVADTDASPDNWTAINFGALTNPMTTGGDLIYGGASGSPARLANGSSGQYLKSNGGTSAPSWQSFVAPTVQRFTSGSGTYTTPVGVRYIIVTCVGGGGGGGSSGTASFGASSGGGGSSFGTSLLAVNGGGGGSQSSHSAGGVVTSAASPAVILHQVDGSNGGGAAYNNTASAGIQGGMGAASPLGGAGLGGAYGTSGQPAKANTGSGGGGGGGAGAGATGFYSGGGGAGGGYIRALIESPSASYSYSVGAGGSGGTAGTSGFAGGNGGSGLVLVEEYY